jgi:hypothetical protein
MKNGTVIKIASGTTAAANNYLQVIGLDFTPIAVQALQSFRDISLIKVNDTQMSYVNPAGGAGTVALDSVNYQMVQGGFKSFTDGYNGDFTWWAIGY